MLNRINTYKNELIIVDGMWGVGKSLLAPLINGFKGVEQYRTGDGLIEFISILSHLEEISQDAASTILKQHVDAMTFQSTVSREINFRLFDDSSHFKNHQWKRYLSNLFVKDHGQFNNLIIKKNPACFLMTHNLKPKFNLFHHSFGSRLKFIHISRNPVYCLKYWSEYLPRVGVDPKEQTITVGNKKSVPWFIGDEDEYVEATNIEKAIIMYRNLDALNNKNHQADQFIMNIPLEDLIKNTDKWMLQISTFLKRELEFDARKKMKLPRAFLEGFNGPAKSLLEEKEYFKSCLNYIQINSSKEKFIEFMSHVERYEDKMKKI